MEGLRILKQAKIKKVQLIQSFKSVVIMRFVIALGGNAISRQGEKGDIQDQVVNCRKTVRYIAELAAKGHSIVLTHGNGPQVGDGLRRSEAARHAVHSLPLDICGAHTQGGIGYLLQREMTNAFRKIGVNRIAVTIITQSVVDPKDPAFKKPTKPVGPFFPVERVPELEKKGWIVVEDAGRGYRRVVPSPRPVRIVEEDFIRRQIDGDAVVICCGGGGIPVIETPEGINGIEGVIDKDFATSLLACHINADMMIITTGVEKVVLGYNTPQAKPLDHMALSEARRYLEEGQFPPGSMGPKIAAAIQYIETTGKDVIITLPEALTEAMAGRAGTRIHPD
jgi:carbamate kinase